MSTFSAQCPNCSSLCDVPSVYINQEVKCPSCAEAYVAEPYLELPSYNELPVSVVEQEPLQAPITKEEASLPEGHYIAVFGKYSIGVSKSEPLLHRLLRWATVLALVLWFQNVIELFGDDSEIEGMDRWILVWNGLISVMLFWGAAQLVQFFHAIAWNTQEARRKRGDS